MGVAATTTLRIRGDYVTAAESRTSTFSDCEPSNSSWHGTSTASLVGALANNGGMVGAAPGVKVLPVRVLGKCYGSDSDIQAAMLWAAGIPVPGVPDNPNPARVINMSLGGSGSCSASYQDVVNRVRSVGTVIVAAAGNSAGGPVSTPGNCDGVIAVLALLWIPGAKVGFSDLGPEISIAAPGGNCINIAAGTACLYPILAATDIGTQGALASSWTDSFNASLGTSYSSPLVAGVAGLMFSARPSLSPDQVRMAMRATARPFPTSGSDNGPDDTAPVAQCRAPVSGTDQYQCYCTTALCGAGMLDAGKDCRLWSKVSWPTDPSKPQSQNLTSCLTGNQVCRLRIVRSWVGPGPLWTAVALPQDSPAPRMRVRLQSTPALPARFACA